MLGCKQQRHPKLFYSLINLDERIRPDNPLWRIHDIIDFSFVRPQVEHFYGSRGNPSIGPGPSRLLRVYARIGGSVQKQGRYEDAEKYLFKALKGRCLKLGDTHPHTLESWKSLIELYEAWNKPEKAEEWRIKLPQTDAVEE